MFMRASMSSLCTVENRTTMNPIQRDSEEDPDCPRWSTSCKIQSMLLQEGMPGRASNANGDRVPSILVTSIAPNHISPRVSRNSEVVPSLKHSHGRAENAKGPKQC